ncbi:MAG: hypothetical protein IPI67_38705 [Myxococcales bacterium]|nr:hypothetical protein [Myxococcales bacterium]
MDEARSLNLTASGAAGHSERLEASMADGGVAGCGKAQVCIDSARPRDAG